MVIMSDDLAFYSPMKRKKALQHIGIGMAMGTADIIPGVSGGTIAFISGIYDKLVTSIARIDGTLFRYLQQGKIKKAWTYIQGTFLLQLFGGIIIAVISLAHGMSYALATYPIYVYALFFGLIVASIVLIVKQHLSRPYTLQIVSVCLVGIAI
jgi:putative membrane protein